jgi:hypothetical protein
LEDEEEDIDSYWMTLRDEEITNLKEEALARSLWRSLV